MSKKVLLNMPISEGGYRAKPVPTAAPEKPETEIVRMDEELKPIAEVELEETEIVRMDEELKPIAEVELEETVIELENKLTDLEQDEQENEYMTVADYAKFIDRPTPVVYRMIRDNTIEFVKIKNKLHVIL